LFTIVIPDSCRIKSSGFLASEIASIHYKITVKVFLDFFSHASLRKEKKLASIFERDGNDLGLLGLLPSKEKPSSDEENYHQ
jgi:hypothetical protein